MTTLAANNQTVLFLKESVRDEPGGVAVPIVVQSDTVIGLCPIITVQALDSAGNVLSERTADTNFGLDVSLDFVDCTAGVELNIPQGTNPVRFRALDEDGDVLAEGDPITFSELKSPVSEGGVTGTLSGVQSSLSGLLVTALGFVLLSEYYFD